jgi:hypothetical protein
MSLTNQVLYGAQPWNPNDEELDLNYDAIGKNSEAFTVYDPVTYSSGKLVVAGTTNGVAGVVAQTVTMTSTNETVAKVQPGYVPVSEDTVFLMGTNSDLTGNATDVGTFYKLTAATTGTVQVDVANGVQTTTNRVVMIKQVDPQNIGGTGSGSGLRQALVVFVKKYTDVAGV